MPYLLIVALLAWLAPAHAQSVQNEHTDHGTLTLELDNGRRWTTDAPLRAGMERIRDAVVTTNVESQHAGGLDEQKAERLAAVVENAIVYMISNCRLEPRADANLHMLLARLSGGAAAIRADPKPASGLALLIDALAVYPRYFEHAGWNPVEGAH
jgi:hypothetical protein